MQGVVHDMSMPYVSPADTHKSKSGSGFNLGQRVFHQKFGEGVVLNYEGEGRHARVQVNFDSEGSKWLMMEYANLVVTG